MDDVLKTNIKDILNVQTQLLFTPPNKISGYEPG